MGGYFLTVLTISAWIALVMTATVHRAHKCLNKIETPIAIKDTCTGASLRFLQGYTLNKSEFPGKLDSDINAISTKLGSTPLCTFRKIHVDYQTVCCAGWGGSNCDKRVRTSKAEKKVRTKKSRSKREVHNMLKRQTIKETNTQDPSTCSSYGPNHYRSFDGRDFTFLGRCSYLLVKDEPLRIEVTNIDCDRNSTCRKELKMRFNSQNFFVVRGEKFLLNGQDEIDIKGGFSGANITVHTVGGTYVMHYYGGVTVTWDTTMAWTIAIKSEKYDMEKPGASFEGMCGNNNGNQNDDFQTPNGVTTTSPSRFGNSWAVLGKPHAKGGEYVNNCLDPDARKDARKHCDIIHSVKFKECRGVVHLNAWFQRCVNDYCEREDSLCCTLQALANECESNSVAVQWQSEDFCRDY